MSSTNCPQCGAPRAWVGWRLCPCGYDFGPGIELPVREIDSRPARPKVRRTWSEFLEFLLVVLSSVGIWMAFPKIMSAHPFFRLIVLFILLETRTTLEGTVALRKRLLLFGTLALLTLLINLFPTSTL
jgi:hypothetical protein